MAGINIKTMLLILLVCVLAGMILALTSPDVLSAGIGVMQPADSSAAAPEPTPGATAGGKRAPSQPSARTATKLPESTGGAASGDVFTCVETVYVSPEKDRWTYSNPGLAIDVKKTVTGGQDPLVYYAADIRMKEPSALGVCYAGPGAGSRTQLLPEVIAAKARAVLAVNTDGYLADRSRKGLMIRDGKAVCSRKKADTLALMPDGTLRIYSPGEAAADDLLALGVRDALSFGPALIRDGSINDKEAAAHRLAARSARAGIGVVRPGHFVIIVVDGVDESRSVGVSLSEFTALFRQFRCKQAYNLEGGRAAALCFLGKQINGLPGQKRQKLTDMLCVGVSDLAK